MRALTVKLVRAVGRLSKEKKTRVADSIEKCVVIGSLTLERLSRLPNGPDFVRGG